MIRRTSKLLLETLGTLVAGLALIMGVAAWRLSAGPITLDFLTPYIEQALSAPNGAYSLKLDRTVLAWSRAGRTLNIRAQGVRAYDAQNHLLANFPEVAVRLSVSGLLHGVVAPTALGIRGAHLYLHREADGSFNIQFGNISGGPAAGNLMPSIVEDLLTPHDPSRPITYLQQVSITDADLVVEDSHWDTSWKTALSRLVFSRSAAGIRANASLTVTVDNRTSNFELNGRYEAATRVLTLDASFQGVLPASFAPAAPALAPLARLNLPVDGRVSAKILKGRDLDAISFDVVGANGSLDLHELYPENLPVDQIEARGTLSQGGSRLDLDELFIDLGDARIKIDGTASGLDGDSTIGFEVSAQDIAVNSLSRRWPATVAPNPRQWILQNLSNGKIDDLRATVVARGHGTDPGSLQVGSLSGTMQLSGIDVHYLGKMPEVVGVGGDVRFDDKSFSITTNSGSVEGLTLKSGSIVMSGLDTSDQSIAIELVTQGSLRDTLRLIDHDPLGYAKGLGINPQTVDGDAATRLSLQFPLVKDLTLAQVQVAAAANMQNVGIQSLVLGQNLSRGQLALKVNKDGMKVSGTADIGPVPASLEWAETFGKKPQQRIHVSGEFDDAARAAFGIHTSDLITGTIPVEIDMRGRGRQLTEAQIAMDLTKAALTIPRMGWHKAPGAPGKATATVLLADYSPTSIPNFAVQAGDLTVRGRASFAASSGDFQSVSLEQLDFGLNKLRGTVTRRVGNGGYDITVEGESLDAAPWLKSSSQEANTPPSREQGPPLSIKLSVSKLWLAKAHRLALNGANGQIEHNGDHVTRAAISAQTFNGKSVSIAMDPAGTKTKLAIRSDDAGAVLQTLDITDNIVGGKLDVTATIDDAHPDAPIPGLAKITDYKMINAPFIAKLLTLASFSGIVDRLSGQGISFSVFEVPFTKTGDVVRLTDARTVGSDLGITFDGTINFTTEIMDINGTIVPVYTLNSLLGNIPLLGNILVGPKGGGIFAATYTATGKLDDPQVSVNPLAALAPGILRSFMGILGGGTMPPTADEPKAPSDLKN